jgi:hypothetical protein
MTINRNGPDERAARGEPLMRQLEALRRGMSAARWRAVLIAIWMTLACAAFVSIGSVAARSWLLLLVSGVIPPAMLVWLWNEDQPQLIGSLRPAPKRL